MTSTPAATVTSSYTVTNPGNTPLSDVADHRRPLRPGRARRSPAVRTSATPTTTACSIAGETWAVHLHPAGSPVAGAPRRCRNFVNTAEVTGLDPTGDQVTDGATDDVDVFTPCITLDKTVNGADEVTVYRGGDRRPTVRRHQRAATPRSPRSTSPTTPPPCEEPTLADDGDGDDILDLGESWTYDVRLRARPPTSSTPRTSPRIHLTRSPATPFPSPNPPVTDEDTASVVVVNAAIDLTKVAEPEVVLLDPGPSPPGETVHLHLPGRQQRHVSA